MKRAFRIGRVVSFGLCQVLVLGGLSVTTAMADPPWQRGPAGQTRPNEHGQRQPAAPHGNPTPPPPAATRPPGFGAPAPHADRGRPVQPGPAPHTDRGRPQPPQALPTFQHGRAAPAPARPLPPPARVERVRPAPPPPIYVPMAPPRARHEAPPPRPSPTHVWINGYWGWQNDHHVWIDGRWATPPERGYQWEPARWRRKGPRWVFVPGHWQLHGHIWVEPTAPAPVYAAPAPAYAAPVYAAPAYAAPAYPAGPITIAGYVTSMQGAPIAGVMVTLAGTREGRIVTDNSGYYAFSGLAPGSYSVRPTGGGCAFEPSVVNLNNLGTSVTQNIIVSGCGGW
jgi:hypothetical protein